MSLIGMFNMKQKSKWSAWKEVSSLSLTRDDAMQRYVDRVKQLFSWEPQNEGKEQMEQGSGGMGNSVSTMAMPSEDKDTDDSHPVFGWAREGDVAQVRAWTQSVRTDGGTLTIELGR